MVRLAELRRYRGLTQSELAAKLKVSASYIAAVESGRKPITEALWAKIKKALRLK